jgi:hypothetical protein
MVWGGCGWRADRPFLMQDWQEHYSDLPLDDFAGRIKDKFYPDLRATSFDGAVASSGAVSLYLADSLVKTLIIDVEDVLSHDMIW